MTIIFVGAGSPKYLTPIDNPKNPPLPHFLTALAVALMYSIVVFFVVRLISNYDSVGNWVQTDAEFAIAQAERERQKRLELAEKLKSLSAEQLTILGINRENLE